MPKPENLIGSLHWKLEIGYWKLKIPPSGIYTLCSLSHLQVKGYRQTPINLYSLLVAEGRRDDFYVRTYKQETEHKINI